MIIEDEPDTAEMYAEMMRISGYEVVKFFGGLPAIDQLQDQNADAIVLDLMMPDLSGLEVLHYIQNQPDLAQLPVVIVSAKTLPEDIAEGLKAGAIAYLTKPVSYAEMRKIIEQAVTGTSKTQGEN